MRETFLLLAVAAGLSGCATSDSRERTADAGSADAQKTRRVCSYESSTSSRLGTKKCRDVPVTE